MNIFWTLQSLKLKRELDERPNVIGFIGRLSPEKDILNLIHAIPLVVRRGKRALKFVICGDDELFGVCKELIKKEN